MKIRLATLQDLPILISFGHAITIESPTMQKQGFDDERAASVFSVLINTYESIFIAEHDDGAVVGAMISILDTDWRTGQRVAHEQGLYVLPAYRCSNAASLLIERFEKYAHDNAADRMVVGTITGIEPEKVLKLYQRKGFELVGYTLGKEV